MCVCLGKLCVGEEAGGGGGGGGGRRTGSAQPKTRTPHTKMWGTKVFLHFAQAASCDMHTY